MNEASSAYVDSVMVTFNNYSFKRGSIENPVLSYKSRLNLDKHGIKDPTKGRWELTELTYYFVQSIEGEQRTIVITDKSRKAVLKAKSDDEVRIKRERRHKDNGYSETSLDEIRSENMHIPCDNKHGISVEELVVLKIDLENAINKLSEAHQEIIKLRYFKNMTLDEIGKLKGVKKSSVQKMEKRALELMKKSLGNYTSMN